MILKGKKNEREREREREKKHQIYGMIICIILILLAKNIKLLCGCVSHLYTHAQNDTQKIHCQSIYTPFQ